MAKSSDPTLTLARIIPGIVTDDGHGNMALRVVVSSENVPPTNILLSNSSVETGSTTGTRIGILTVVDSNADDVHTLEVTNDPDEKFDIENPVTGDGIISYLILKDSVDFNIKELHSLQVKATDSTNLSVIVSFSIEVTSVFQNITSLDFNGIDEYCTGGDIHLYDINDTFSICGWLKPSNIANAMIFFSKATIDANVNGYMLRSDATTGALYLQMRTTLVNTLHTFDTALTAGEWQFICFTYSGALNISGASVYRNAVKNVTTPSGALSGTMLQGQPFYLGQRNNSFGFYNGIMDEVSVWDKELTQVEITELYNEGIPYDISTHSASANLKSWYRFDGDTIPSISDNVGSDNLSTVNMDSSNLLTDVP